MERRLKRGTLFVAGAIAVALILIAFAATRTGHARATGSLVVIQGPPVPAQDLNGNGIPDWQEALNANSGASSTAPYVAPASLPPTDALARELFADYADAKQGGT